MSNFITKIFRNSTLIVLHTRAVSKTPLLKSDIKNRCKTTFTGIVPLSETQRLLPAPRNPLRYRSIVSVGLQPQRCHFNEKVLKAVVFNNNNNNLYYSSSLEAAVQLKMQVSKPFQRLPDTVVPSHYRLSLVPDLKTLTFHGNVSIEIEVKKEIEEVVLNALDLDLESAELNGEKSHQALNISYDTEHETASFRFKSHISPGHYSLDIVFKGEINDKMKGLYRSKYVNESGEEVYAAVTQFEATDARRCFPCWDEPALKATFDISLTVPKNLVALSNMPVHSQEEKDSVIKYTFEKTPIMSTYLVAAVIGEYDYVEDKSSDGVRVRVYTPKGKKEQGKFALEVATKVLPYYKGYFNIAYPLPKIDLIAIADFSAGAMENWGLVTYRETCLLVDPQNTSASSKQLIALVVGHELAHQWFGNLVTMEWWTHLWLNEGYASFVEFLCVNYLFPEYDIWTQFVNDSYIRALELDSLNNSHPIEVPVGNPSEIDEIFDDISYNKGASVIRMLHHYIGDEHFRKGMHLYLTKHQYKNTFTEDLWAALEEASQKPVRAVMSTWTKQMGFPVVTVTRSGGGEGVKLTLQQNKFTADGSPPAEDYLWMIPISISTSKNPAQEVVSTVLESRTTEILVPDVSATDWLKVNPGTIGFYRTKYPPEMLEKFIPAIRDKSLPPLDRLGLLDDLFAMVKAGQTGTVEVLKFLRAFEDETDYNVWCSINNILGKLSQLLAHTDAAEAYDEYQKQLLSKVYHRLGWNVKPDETHLDTLLRALILGRLALLNDESTIKEARTRFDDHVKGTQSIPADLRSACYKTVLRAGGHKEYDTLLELYRSTDLHEEKDRISRALGAAKDAKLLQKTLDFAMSDEVRSQDSIFVIIMVALNRAGRDLAWQFLKDNWSKITDRYSGALLTRLIKYCAENFSTQEKHDEVLAFFKDNKAPGAERTVQQSVETILLNVQWLQRDSEAIKKYLTSST